MRMNALHLASFMSDVGKPYIVQTNDVTPGMSTSSDVSDRKADTCLSDVSATSRWNGFNFPFLKKHDVKSQPVNACIPSSASVIPACFSFRMAAIFDTAISVSSVISGTVVEDDVTSARSSGKPKKNHQDVRVGRPYQYVSLRCLLCMEGDERVGFFVLTLKVDRLSDHQIMLVVVLHHHAFSTM